LFDAAAAIRSCAPLRESGGKLAPPHSSAVSNVAAAADSDVISVRTAEGKVAGCAVPVRAGLVAPPARSKASERRQKGRKAARPQGRKAAKTSAPRPCRSCKRRATPRVSSACNHHVQNLPRPRPSLPTYSSHLGRPI
jgi:hypothetical protein